MPSAMVAPPVSTVRPANVCVTDAYAATSTPITSIPGRSATAATAQPEIMPPPPTGMTNTSRSGASSSNSSASVP